MCLTLDAGGQNNKHISVPCVYMDPVNTSSDISEAYKENGNMYLLCMSLQSGVTKSLLWILLHW